MRLIICVKTVGTVELVAVALHHNHLPTMADLGVIDYDSDSNCVEEIRYEQSI
jgi:hypothetical protein